MTNHEQLRAVAEAASTSQTGIWAEHIERMEAYHHAANPFVVLSLLDENAQLKAELGDLPEAQAEMLSEIKRLKAELASLREQKPVAWGMPRVDGRIYDVICTEEHHHLEGRYTVPFYAAPGAKV